jgi:GntR family transcriptional regulator, transcriptional repressor for pyruvate dehydrogenase complex
MSYPSSPGPEGGQGGQNTSFTVAERAVLEVLAMSDRPMGAASMQERLSDLGYQSSEATVGRTLRAMDRKGFTTQSDNRGRVLTTKGHERLRELNQHKTRQDLEDQLRQLLRSSTVNDILEILSVRHVLERYVCREAVNRASAQDIWQLRAAIRTRRPAGDMPGFHSLLAQASGNQVLATLVELLTIGEVRHQTLRAILTVQDSLDDMEFHEKVVDAIERRDADAAEKALDIHLERIITAVREFGRKNLMPGPGEHDG